MSNSGESHVRERRHGSGLAAGLAGATAVVLGALGVHMLGNTMTDEMLAVWRTAVRFQFWHALALAACALIARPSRSVNFAAVLFAAGIVLFCGSLYALALGAPRALGVATPIGGLCFIAGWVALGLGLYRQRVEGPPR